MTADSEGHAIILPKGSAKQLVHQIHQVHSHLGHRKLKELLQGCKGQGTKHLTQDLADHTARLRTTHAPIKEPLQKAESGVNSQGLIGKYTEIKPGTYGYKYLLVFIDTFSGWIEAYPTRETDISWKASYPGIVCQPYLGLTMDQHSFLKLLNL